MFIKGYEQINKSTGGKHPVPSLADTLDGGPNPAPLGLMISL